MASFIDPDKFRPEEAWDGAVPGVFEVPADITDDELRSVALTVAQLRGCLKAKTLCPYPINGDDRTHWTNNDTTAAINTDNLIGISIDKDYKAGKSCYSMIFETPHGGATGIGICYRNETVSKVEVGEEIIE
jgi:hypothetical protein